MTMSPKDKIYIKARIKSLQEVQALPPRERDFIRDFSKFDNQEFSEERLWDEFAKWISKWNIYVLELEDEEDYETLKDVMVLLDDDKNEFKLALDYLHLSDKDTNDQITELMEAIRIETLKIYNK